MKRLFVLWPSHCVWWWRPLLANLRSPKLISWTFLLSILSVFWCLINFSTIVYAQVIAVSGQDELLLQTLNGRYNYASSDCAARILSTNRGAKSANSILQSQRDSYLLNLCSYTDKHVILELCQDIRIDTLVIGNFEYFSSMAKEFRIFTSKKYPGDWKLLGSFEAENSKKEQAFAVNASTMYARYVRLDFGTHYGNEYYCLISSVRIYGKTMMEDFEESVSVGLPRAMDHATTATAAAAIVLDEATREKNPIPIVATIVSQDSPEKVRKNPFADALAKGGTIMSEEVTFTLPIPPMDINDLFKQHKEFCQATLASDHFSPSRETLSSHETTTAVNDSFIIEDGQNHHQYASIQENIFKAIYDKLYALERNATRAARTLDDKVKRVEADVKFIQNEMDVTDHDNSSVFAGRKTYRVRLLNHLERKNEQLLNQLEIDAANLARSMQRDNRLIFWIAIFALLQITALVCVVSTGFALGWFKPNPAIASLSRHDLLLLDTIKHKRSSSHPSNYQRISTDDQKVPNEVYRGNSPSQGDLIATAGKPLLLDESEAETIDATYIPSPLSVSNSEPESTPYNPSDEILDKDSSKPSSSSSAIDRLKENDNESNEIVQDQLLPECL